MLSRAFVHEANQSLHVIRLAAESLSLECRDGRLTNERLEKRLATILGQADLLTHLIREAGSAKSQAAAQPSNLTPSIAIACAPLRHAYTQALSSALRQHGYAVDVCDSGASLLELFQTRVCDVLITDLCLPDINSWDLIQGVEELQPEITVVVANESIDEPTRDRLARCSAQIVAASSTADQIAEVLAGIACLPADAGV